MGVGGEREFGEEEEFVEGVGGVEGDFGELGVGDVEAAFEDLEQRARRDVFREGVGLALQQELAF